MIINKKSRGVLDVIKYTRFRYMYAVHQLTEYCILQYTITPWHTAQVMWTEILIFNKINFYTVLVGPCSLRELKTNSENDLDHVTVRFHPCMASFTSLPPVSLC